MHTKGPCTAWHPSPFSWHRVAVALRRTQVTRESEIFRIVEIRIAIRQTDQKRHNANLSRSRFFQR